MPEAYAPKLRRPATLDHLRKKEPLEKTIEVILSDGPILELERAQQAVANARNDADKKKALLGVETAKATVEEATVEIKFRSIGRKAYEALVDLYPPTPDQIEELKAEGLGKPQYNTETFPPALVAASAIEPKMTLEDALEIWDTWNSNELTEIFFAALAVNTGRRVVPLVSDFGTMNT